MRTDTPVQTKLDDYTPYPFAIESVDMAFDLESCRDARPHPPEHHPPCTRRYGPRRHCPDPECDQH